MNAKKKGTIPLSEKALLDDRNLAEYLDCGLSTARKISREAGAERWFGRTKRNDRQLIDKYLKCLRYER